MIKDFFEFAFPYVVVIAAMIAGGMRINSLFKKAKNGMTKEEFEKEFKDNMDKFLLIETEKLKNIHDRLVDINKDISKLENLVNAIILKQNNK